MSFVIISVNNDFLTSENYSDFFPFADDFGVYSEPFFLGELSSWQKLLALLPDNADKIILCSQISQKSYSREFFISESGKTINQYQMLPRRDWDLSRSSWVTKSFADESQEKIFNARNIIYKKFGMNFRLIRKDSELFCCSVENIKNAVELCRKSNLPLEKVDSILIAYLEMLN